MIQYILGVIGASVIAASIVMFIMGMVLSIVKFYKKIKY
jgi:hypothetical protein